MTDIYLNPGEHFAGDARHRVHTVLGSCVSITLWHPDRRVGAMSHFVLGRAAQPSGGELDGRYCADALTLMTQRLGAFGIDVRTCEAKLFGGGDMFPEHSRPGDLAVGRRNGESARAMLEARGLAVASGSLFGVGHRRIVFDISTGDVWARQSSPASMPASLE